MVILHYTTYAQTTQHYGQVDKADLLMKQCGFEKDANAMILFHKGEAITSLDSVSITYHERIKIFTEAGKDNANIRIPYYSGREFELINGVEAETINLEGD